MIVGAAPFYNRGAFAGVVALGCHLTDLRQAVLGGDIGDTGYGFVINERGEVVIGPDKVASAEDVVNIAKLKHFKKCRDNQS